MKLTKLSSAIMLASVVTLTACAPDKTPEQFKTEAQQFLTSNNVSSALLRAKQGLKAAPEDQELRLILAKAYLRGDDYLGAEKELQKYIAKDQTDQAYRLLAETKLRLGKQDELFVIAKKKINGAQAKAHTLFFAGLAALNTKEEEKYAEFLAELNGVDSHHFSHLLKSWSYYTKGDYENAAMHLGHVQGNSRYASQFSAMLAETNGEYIQAKELYESHFEEFGEDLSTLVSYYQVLVSLNETDIASTVVDKIYQRSPTNAQFNLYKAQMAFQKQQFDDAISHATITLNAQPQNIAANLIVGISAYQNEDHQMAVRHLSQYKGQISDPVINNILRLSYLNTGQHDAMLADMDEVNVTTADLDVLLMASVRINNKQRQERVVEMMTDNLDTKSPQALMQVGMAKLAMNDSSGIDYLEQSTSLAQSDDGEILLALAYITNEQYGKVNALMAQWDDNATRTKLVKALVLRKQGNNKESIKLYKDVLKAEPENGAALMALAKYHVSEKSYDVARAHLETLIALEPYNNEALYYLTVNNRLNGQLPDTVKFLSNLEAKTDQTNIALGATYVELTQPNDALAALSDVEIGNHTPEYFLAMTDAHLQLGLTSSALTTLKDSIKRYPNALSLRTRYILTMELAQRYSAALYETKNAMAAFKQEPVLKLLEIRYLLLGKQYKTALTKIQEARSSVAPQELYPYEAEALFMASNYEDAVELYELAYKNDQSVELVVGLAKSYRNVNRVSDAIDALTKHLENKPHAQLHSLLAELLYPIDKEASYEHFYRAVEMRETYINLNNLANLAMDLGKTEAALEYSEKAYRQKGNLTQIMNTYGKALYINKQFDEARDVLEASVNKGTKYAPAHVTLANVYAELGLINLEAQQLRSALALNPDPELKKEIESRI